MPPTLLPRPAICPGCDLLDYLVRKGYNITLLTEQFLPFEFEHTYPIVSIPIYSGSTPDWAFKIVWTLLTDWHNRAFAKKAKSEI